jgi:hypothetical protein
MISRHGPVTAISVIVRVIQGVATITDSVLAFALTKSSDNRGRVIIV